MAELREIKERIDSIEGTKKITGAMYMISPFELTVRAPKTYKYFNKIFGLYDE